MVDNCAIVLAGGRGKRMGTSTPKQYAVIDGYPLIYYSLKAFEDCAFIDGIVLVTLEEDIDYCRKEIVARYGFVKVKKSFRAAGKGTTPCTTDLLLRTAAGMCLSMTRQDRV